MLAAASAKCCGASEGERDSEKLKIGARKVFESKSSRVKTLLDEKCNEKCDVQTKRANVVSGGF